VSWPAARELLRAAGVAAQLPGAVDVVDTDLQELFGWVVREGVTNVVRHARATTATIALGPNWIEIVDDGRASMLTAAPGGNGLAGLRERVAGVAGTVEAGGCPQGWRLRVEIPSERVRPSTDSAIAPVIVTNAATATEAALTALRRSSMP